jgi:hypothetical protein
MHEYQLCQVVAAQIYTDSSKEEREAAMAKQATDLHHLWPSILTRTAAQTRSGIAYSLVASRVFLQGAFITDPSLDCLLTDVSNSSLLSYQRFL